MSKWRRELAASTGIWMLICRSRLRLMHVSKSTLKAFCEFSAFDCLFLLENYAESSVHVFFGFHFIQKMIEP